MSEEFKGGEKLKFVRNEAEKDVDKMSKDFFEQMEEMDHLRKFEMMMKDIRCDGRKWKGCKLLRGEMLEKKTIAIILLEEWHREFLRKLDKVIINKVSDEIKKLSDSRTRISETVFNFSTKDVPAEVMKKLNLGSNYAMHTKRNEDEARSKLNNELLAYLRKYRQYIERKTTIHDDDVGTWLENAIREADDNQHLRFYSEVSKHLSIDLGIGRRVKESEVDFKILDKMELCVVEADKGMGLVILDIERLISADDEMVIELGGAKLENKTCEDIMEDLKKKIDEFESNLDVFSRKFLNIYYEDRVEQSDRAMIPFLKLKPNYTSRVLSS